MKFLQSLRLPGQLTLRLATLLCVLLAINSYVFISMYRAHLRSSVAPKMAVALASEVNGLKADIGLVPADRLSEWLAARNSTEGVRLEQLPPGTVHDYTQPNRYETIVQTNLRRLAGEDVGLFLEGGVTALYVHVDFDAGGHRYGLSIPGNGMEALGVWPISWLFLSLALTVMICVVFAITQINKPLQKTAEALVRNADRLTEIQMPATASREFQVFAGRFNELVRRLQAQERERAMLLAGVSHDLRAPLTRIRLRAAMMKDGGTSLGSAINADTESMRHIIDQFLDYQRVGVSTQKMLVDLKHEVTEVVGAYRESGRDVRSLATVDAFVQSDPSAIERILNNLIDNALTYGAEPIEVSLSLEGKFAQIQIRDHGVGIEESQIVRMLRPFERLDESRNLQGHCGLGLSIVERIVKDNEGSLHFSNHAGGGLVVRVLLPGAEEGDQK